MKQARERRREVGRPGAGIRPGEKVREYKRITVRLPDDVRAELEAAAGALKRPAWRVVLDAVRAYVGSGPGLSEDEKRVVRAVLKLHS
jgi:hypothetical protein